MLVIKLPPNKLERVPETTLVTVLAAIVAGPSKERVIEQYTDLGTKTVQRSLRLLLYLGLIQKVGDSYSVDGVVMSAKGTSDLSLRMRDALLSSAPFLAVLDQIVQGEAIAGAIRKVAALSGNRTEDCDFINVLIKLAEDLGVVRSESGAYVVTDAYAPAKTPLESVMSSESGASEAKARLTIAKELGPTVFSFLDEIDRHLLTDAMVLQHPQPSKACEKAGQALEDFLRHVADQKGFGSEAGKMNGASQVAQLLVGKGVIVDKHLKLIDMVGALRNTTAHKKDKSTLKPWKVSPLAAASSVACTLTIIRALYGYAFEGGNQVI